IVGLNCLTGPDPDTSDYFMSTSAAAKGGAGQNTWVYNNPEVDELLKKGAELVNPEEGQDVYPRTPQTMSAERTFPPIFQYAVIPGYKNGLERFASNINNRIDTWNIRSWRWA